MHHTKSQMRISDVSRTTLGGRESYLPINIRNPIEGYCTRYALFHLDWSLGHNSIRNLCDSSFGPVSAKRLLIVLFTDSVHMTVRKRI